MPHSRPEDAPSPTLSPGDLLQAEYAYIAQTAFQANEDRARVITFYLVNLGGLAAALIGSQLGSALQPEGTLLLGLLFAIFSVSGLLTILQLVRLRLAWFESMQAMNAIKDYYQAHFPALHLERALRWDSRSAPPRYKPGSISHLLALQAAVLSGISLGAAVYYLGLLAGWQMLAGAPLAGGVYFVVQMEVYRRALGKK